MQPSSVLVGDCRRRVERLTPRPYRVPLLAAVALSALLTGAPRVARTQARSSADSSRVKAATRENPPPIQDNSFLIEEAYNQGPGVVQHISTFIHDQRSGAFVYQFTQEWPVPGVRHQLSYSVPFVRNGESSAGLGDARVNYRYQLVGDADASIAVAPRLTAILATGDYRRGRGSGAPGVEGWFPISVALKAPFVVHGNVGGSVTPRAQAPDGSRATARNWTTGGSVVWLALPSFSPLVELLYESTEEPIGQGTTQRSSSVTLSPGIRWAYNFASGLQIVPGIAVPMGLGPSRDERSLLVYLSFEHPFTKRARDIAKAR
jgi:hypothetical protein